MFNIAMKTEQNYASFRNEATGEDLVVESFDNVEFEVFRGNSCLLMEKIGTVTALTDESLVEQLNKLLNQ